MPRPSTDPNWSDDTNYPAGAEAWSATPTKVEPSVGAKQDGFVPATMPPAQWFNWLLNLLSLWVVWLTSERDRLAPFIGGDAGTSEWAYPSTRLRAVTLSPLGMTSGEIELNAGVATPGEVLDTGWRPRELPLYGAGPSGTDEYSESLVMECNTAGRAGYFDLTPHLRDGVSLVGIIVYVETGTVQATTTNRMRATLVSREPVTGAATNHISANAPASAASRQQINLDLVVTPLVISRVGGAYTLIIRSSDGSDTTPDIIEAIGLLFNDPGPRNY